MNTPAISSPTPSLPPEQPGVAPGSPIGPTPGPSLAPPPPGPHHPGLDIVGLETVYDALASAIDRAGPDKTELLLVKLALLNAQALGSAARFQQQLDAALLDL